MHRVSFLALPVALLLAATACPAAGDVAVEVLPPRTSVTCAAPTKTDPALGRGLLDVQASADRHGGYVADLRLSLKGADARVTGLDVEYAFDGDVKVSDDNGALAVGDVVLSGEDADLRVAILENVPLVSRDLAVALDEADVADRKDFASLEITIKAEVDGVVGEGVSGFTVDICDGCLVAPPDSCDGDGESAAIPTVCRVGQDVVSVACVPGA